MLSLEDLRVIVSVLSENYWPYVARVLESSTSSPLFDIINPDYVTLPTSLDNLQTRFKHNFIRFHVAYIVIITFGLLAKHWHVAVVVAIVHKLGTFVTSLGRGDASLKSDTGQDETTRYAHNLMRGIWLSSGHSDDRTAVYDGIRGSRGGPQLEGKGYREAVLMREAVIPTGSVDRYTC
ncbi:hypothetical protein LZ30DRAFT_809037 [Colletotrichum cereale]|nr:hypothetical protein LZ30DRAFT_809037 [Colletotrichum cereale]